MRNDVEKKVMQWSRKRNVPQNQRKQYVRIARLYQEGEPLPQEEEQLIAEILEESDV